MAGARRLTVEILGDAKGVMGAFGEADKGASSLGDKFTEFGKKAAIAFGAAAAGVGYLAKGALDAAYESQKVAAQTEAIIKSTGEAAGLTAKQVGKLSESLSLKTGVDDEQIQTSLNMLLTFKQVRNEVGKGNDVFNRASSLVLDLGNVFGSTDAAAMQLGKALSDPVKGVGALARAGVNFTAQQKDQIKALVESGKSLEAQKIILAEVESQVGGTAAATATNADRMRVAFGNIQEQVGGLLLPAFEQFAGFMVNNVTPAITAVTDTFQEKGLSGVMQLVSDKFKQDGPKVAAALGDAFISAFNWIGETGLPLLGEKLQELGKALVDWISPRIGPAINALGAFIATAANWIIDKGLPTLVDKLIILGGALVDWIKPRIAPMLEALGELLLNIVTWIVTDAAPKIATQALRLVTALSGWVNQLLPEVLSGLGQFVLDVIRALPGLFVDLVRLFGELGWKLGKAMVGGIADGLGALINSLGDLGRTIVNGIIGFINSSIIRRLNDALDFTISVPFGPDIRVNPPDIPGIPYLAQGGIIQSPTLAVVGEAGPEAVVPLSQAGQFGLGSGASINVYVQGSVTSERDLVETIYNGLLRKQKTGGPLGFAA